MTHTYLDALHTALPTGPYLLGGSGDIGAAIAHEMATRLDDVRLVAAIGTELEPPDGDLVPQDLLPEFRTRSPRVRQANADAVGAW